MRRRAGQRSQLNDRVDWRLHVRRIRCLIIFGARARSYFRNSNHCERRVTRVASRVASSRHADSPGRVAAAASAISTRQTHSFERDALERDGAMSARARGPVHACARAFRWTVGARALALPAADRQAHSRFCTSQMHLRERARAQQGAKFKQHKSITLIVVGQ